MQFKSRAHIFWGCISQFTKPCPCWACEEEMMSCWHSQWFSEQSGKKEGGKFHSWISDPAGKCSLLVLLSLGPDDVVLESSFHCYGNVISVLYGESQRLHCNNLGLKGCLGSSWFILWNWVQKAWPMENSESHIWIVHQNTRKECTYSKGNGILLPQRKGYWQIHNEGQENTVMCFYREQEIIVFGARNCWTLNHWVKLQWLF